MKHVTELSDDELRLLIMEYDQFSASGALDDSFLRTKVEENAEFFGGNANSNFGLWALSFVVAVQREVINRTNFLQLEEGD